MRRAHGGRASARLEGVRQGRMTPESRVMITIQRRMATALDLDAAQIEKLGSWDWYIGVYREQ